MCKYIYMCILCLFFLSCQNRKQKQINELVKYWQYREVLIPQNCIFTLLGKDTVEMQMESSFKVVSYLDSTGCTSCKARLSGWKDFIANLKQENVPVFIFMNTSNSKEMQIRLKRESFNYPVCIDENDSLNKLNHFPSDIAFQTFLLDEGNKVLVIGNPIHNPKVKDLYLKIIRGENVVRKNANKLMKTMVSTDKISASLGNFNWQTEQKARFTLKNTGKMPLVIQNIITSCGCTSVDYTQEPVQPDKEVTLAVTYKAEHPEHFNKTITVYCNTESSPVKLTISGNAQ